MDFFHSGLHWLYIIHNKNHRPSLSDNICQPSAQECYQFMMGFMEEKEGICSDECHPGDIVPHELSGNPASVEVNMRSLENWYRGYEQKRKSSLLFKSSELFVGASNNCGCQQFLHQRKYQIYLVWESNFQVLDKSMEKDTLKLPITALKFLAKIFKGFVLSWLGQHGPPSPLRSPSCQFRFHMPADGMPVVRDWITTWESMMLGGVDLSREPISVNVQSSYHLRLHYDIRC